MRDQETDFASLGQEDDESRPMRLRYGVTAQEATHHEPLEVTLSQEEPELAVDDQEGEGVGVWDDVEPEQPSPPHNRASGAPDDLDEEQVAVPAEQDAMHSIGEGDW